MSPSSRRAWIEIVKNKQFESGQHVALLAEGVDRNPMDNNAFQRLDMSPSSRRAWIEIGAHAARGCRGGSPSSRRAWIEIDSGVLSPAKNIVALLAEGVDRNPVATVITMVTAVALLAEGVDRNTLCNLV